MARRKAEEEHDNHERWLISYADFITLLFAFFVVMYAISSVNDGKYRILSKSLVTAFGDNAPRAIQPTEAPSSSVVHISPDIIASRKLHDAMRKEKEKMTSIAQDIMRVLAPLVRQGKVRVMQSARGVSVEINASVLFSPADAKLSPESGAVLTAVAKVLARARHAIQVEGHTDNVPIASPQYPSNWELSTARASTVVRLFVENGVDEKRLTAMGSAAKAPVDSNDTAEARARNRRVTVVILSALPDPVVEVVIPAPAP